MKIVLRNGTGQRRIKFAIAFAIFVIGNAHLGQGHSAAVRADVRIVLGFYSERRFLPVQIDSDIVQSGFGIVFHIVPGNAASCIDTNRGGLVFISFRTAGFASAWCGVAAIVFARFAGAFAFVVSRITRTACFSLSRCRSVPFSFSDAITCRLCGWLICCRFINIHISRGWWCRWFVIGHGGSRCIGIAADGDIAASAFPTLCIRNDGIAAIIFDVYAACITVFIVRFFFVVFIAGFSARTTTRATAAFLFAAAGDTCHGEIVDGTFRGGSHFDSVCGNGSFFILIRFRRSTVFVGFQVRYFCLGQHIIGNHAGADADGGIFPAHEIPNNTNDIGIIQSGHVQFVLGSQVYIIVYQGVRMGCAAQVVHHTGDTQLAGLSTAYCRSDIQHIIVGSQLDIIGIDGHIVCHFHQTVGVGILYAHSAA